MEPIKDSSVEPIKLTEQQFKAINRISRKANWVYEELLMVGRHEELIPAETVQAAKEKLANNFGLELANILAGNIPPEEEILGQNSTEAGVASCSY